MMAAAPDTYVEDQIMDLSDQRRLMMAKLVLHGYRFECSPPREFPGQIRWWTVRRPDGNVGFGTGGQQLDVVLGRVLRRVEEEL